MMDRVVPVEMQEQIRPFLGALLLAMGCGPEAPAMGVSDAGDTPDASVTAGVSIDLFELVTQPGARNPSVEVDREYELQWSARGARSCHASATAGPDRWDGALDTVAGTRALRFATDTVLTLRCTAGSDAEEQTLAVRVARPENPIEMEFHVVGQPGVESPLIYGAGSIELAWATTNATSCTASSSPTVAGWDGPEALESSGTRVEISGAPTLTLSCGDGVYQRSVSLALRDACSSVSPPVGLRPKSFVYSDPKPSFGRAARPGIEGYGSPFAEFAGHAVQFTLDPHTEYVSIEVTIPEEHPNYVDGHISGSWFFNDSTTSYQNFGFVVYSLSLCPGDFDTSATATCQFAARNGERAYVMSDPEHPYFAYDLPNCLVDRGRTYYLNMLSASGAAGEPADAITDPSRRGCAWTLGGGSGRDCATMISGQFIAPEP
jgi:hypothetical protein